MTIGHSGVTLAIAEKLMKCDKRFVYHELTSYRHCILHTFYLVLLPVCSGALTISKPEATLAIKTLKTIIIKIIIIGIYIAPFPVLKGALQIGCKGNMEIQ